MKFIKYLKYVLRHKWFVFVECAKFGRPFTGLMHDLSKFLPSEFLPYANFFHGKKAKPVRDETGYYKPTDTGDLDFDYAWLLHQKRNKHHWQWWVLPCDEDGEKLIEIPIKYIHEMVADWRGAGKAQGTPDTLKWYIKNKDKMRIHSESRKIIESLIGYKTA
jgi:hypothetical protein